MICLKKKTHYQINIKNKLEVQLVQKITKDATVFLRVCLKKSVACEIHLQRMPWTLSCGGWRLRQYAHTV